MELGGAKRLSVESNPAAVLENGSTSLTTMKIILGLCLNMDRDLEEDLRNDPIIMEKIKVDQYAQNVYASLCNMRWQPAEVFTILKDEYWSCSWRSAGGLVARLRADSAEDYMDWYCSGMSEKEGYAREGTVTDEISHDFARIGWRHSEYPK
jgi:hypothetical protein